MHWSHIYHGAPVTVELSTRQYGTVGYADKKRFICDMSSNVLKTPGCPFTASNCSRFLWLYTRPDMTRLFGDEDAR